MADGFDVVAVGIAHEGAVVAGVVLGPEGWPATSEGRSASYGNCEGWTAMLIHLKAWIEHDLVLREGYDT